MEGCDIMKKTVYNKPWFVYIAQCCDESLYAGVAVDVARRIHEHNHTSKCRYTRSRKPIALVYKESCPNHSTALKREIQIKSLGREKKLALIGKD
jgi:predicted GIY-YIG superfamily endonuclease